VTFDINVDFKEINLYKYADNYLNLKTALELLFKRKVDLLEDKAIKNPFLSESIDTTKLLVYG